MEKLMFFHVNPPEQRGKKRLYKSRASFAGIFVNDELRIGMSYCHGADQFCRKTGRTKAAGKAMVDPQWKFDSEGLPIRDRNDFFVTKCRELCDILKMNHNYRRRTRGAKKQNTFQVA